MNNSITLHPTCYSSLPGKGWHTFVTPAEIEVKPQLIEEHCLYPVWPEYSSEEQVLDYGFRILDAKWACLYRTVYPAGTDEYDRNVHLVHTLIVSRDDLDRVDADVPAIFGWAKQQNLFAGTVEEARGRYRPQDFQATGVAVPIGELSQWRQTRAGIPPLRWLESYPESLRASAAKLALKLALTASTQKRPVLWSGSDRGRGGGRQEYAIQEFLFSVLPHAWRREATFSTYRPPRSLRGFRWMSTPLEQVNLTDSQRRHEYFVVDLKTPKKSSPTPDTNHDWIKRVAKCISDESTLESLQAVLDIAHALEARSNDDVYSDRGLLSRALACARGFKKWEGVGRSCEILATNGRVGHANSLNALFQFVHDAQLGDTFALEQNREELCAAIVRLLDLPEPPDPEGVERLAAGLLPLLQNALEANDSHSVNTLLKLLSDSPHLAPVSQVLMPMLLASFAEKLKSRPEAGFFATICRLCGPHIKPLPKTHAGRVDFSRSMREIVIEHREKILPRLPKDCAEDLFEFFRIDEPQSLREIYHGMCVFETVAESQETDYRVPYLTAICENIKHTGLLSQLADQGISLLLRNRPAWSTVASLLPSNAAMLLEESHRPRLLATVWQPGLGFRDREYHERFDRELTGMEGGQPTAFAELYWSEGAVALTQSLVAAREGNAVPGLALCRRHLSILETGTKTTVPRPEDAPWEHLLTVMECLLTADARGKNYSKKLAPSVQNILTRRWQTDPQTRFQRYCDLGARLSLDRHWSDFEPQAKLTLVRHWADTLGEDNLEGDLIQRCLLFTKQADTIRPQVVAAMVAANPRKFTGEELSPTAFTISQFLESSPAAQQYLVRRAVSEVRGGEIEGFKKWLVPDAPGAALLDDLLPEDQWRKPLEECVDQLDWRTLTQLTQLLPESDDEIARPAQFNAIQQLAVDCVRKRRRFPRELDLLPAALERAPGSPLIDQFLNLGLFTVIPPITKISKRNIHVCRHFSNAVEEHYHRHADAFVNFAPEETPLDRLLSLAMFQCANDFDRESSLIVEMVKEFCENESELHSEILEMLINIEAAEARTRLPMHARLANCLWGKTSRSHLSQFLAYVGEEGLPGNRIYERATRDNPPRMVCGWGVEATAMAVAALLHSDIEGTLAEEWDERLGQLDSDLWERPFRERNLKANWDRFERAIYEEFDDPGVARTVLKKLRNPKPGIWSRLFGIFR